MVKDEVGNRYGKLLVVEYVGIENHQALWKCKCDCGSECVKSGISLRFGHVRSCGCLHREQLVERNKKYDDVSRRLYLIWHGMIRRCENSKCKEYWNYGGRGISVCQEWHNPNIFFQWAKESGYKENLTIERINNNGNYCHDNCKWATLKEQENNRRNNHPVTINGETKNISQWCEFYGINPITVQSRLRYGWSIQDAITKPVKTNRTVL